MYLNIFCNLVPSVDGILAFFNSVKETLGMKVLYISFFWMIIPLKLPKNMDMDQPMDPVHGPPRPPMDLVHGPVPWTSFMDHP